MTIGNRNNHTIQQLDDDCVHDWYRFVLAYPDHLVQEMIQRFGITQQHTVLDPFVGTGTTLVECKKLGIRSTGIDANPATVFASRVKTTWDIDLAELARRSERVLSAVKEETGESDYLSIDTPRPGGQLSFIDLQDDGIIETVVTDESLVNLIPKDAMSEKPLTKLLIARDIINGEPDDPITDIFRLALATVAVRDMSNLGFGPEIYVKRKKRDDADIVLPLSQLLAKIRSDLALVQAIDSPGQTQVFAGDARQLSRMARDPVDFVITSPPYPNEKDYTRITRLELALLGFVTNKKELRNVKGNMLRSHTRNIYKADDDAAYVQDIREIVELSELIEKTRIARQGTSGFEKLYHRVVMEYFGGMHRVFEQLYHLMPSGGKLAIVVGDQKSFFRIPIRTAELLSIVAQRLDFHEVETLVWRTRQATALKEEIEEHILILERG